MELINHVPANKTCEWQLAAKDPTKRILLTFMHVQMHAALEYTYRSEADCIAKGARVLDGLTDTSPLRARFCKSHPPDIISNGHALTLTVPLSIIAELSAYAYLMDDYCGGYYTSLRGRFTTPHYPSSYPVNIDCTWLIDASQGNRIQVTFESMDLEDSDDCNNDYVEIRDYQDYDQLLGVFCGNRVPPTMSVKEFVIHFKSNNDIVGEGFMASYAYGESWRRRPRLRPE